MSSQVAVAVLAIGLAALNPNMGRAASIQRSAEVRVKMLLFRILAVYHTCMVSVQRYSRSNCSTIPLTRRCSNQLCKIDRTIITTQWNRSNLLNETAHIFEKDTSNNEGKYGFFLKSNPKRGCQHRRCLGIDIKGMLTVEVILASLLSVSVQIVQNAHCLLIHVTLPRSLRVRMVTRLPALVCSRPVCPR